MKTRIIYLIGATMAIFTISKSQAQEITASLADDLAIGKLSSSKEESTPMFFNKKVKLTNTENGKTVVVRINDRMKLDNNKIANISKGVIEEIGIKAGKAKVKVQEIQGDEVERLWASAASTSSIPISPTFKKIVKEKEVEVETTKLEGFDISQVYDLNGHIKELSGFGLQIAAFTQLKAAKDFAVKLVKNGDAETEKVLIQVSKSADKPMVYRVVYGLFEDKINAEYTKKKMESLGYNSFVKGF